MARFDYHRGQPRYLLDCQADLLSYLNTRLVVPLLPIEAAPPPAARLNPRFKIDGQDHVMVTQFAAAIRLRDLGPRGGSLAAHDRAIMDAIDMLLTGF